MRQDICTLGSFMCYPSDNDVMVIDDGLYCTVLLLSVCYFSVFFSYLLGRYHVFD